MKKLIYLVLALPLLASKCEKDPPVVVNKPVVIDSTIIDSTKTELDKLPPITTSGLNTFGCLLNGKAWLPTSGGTTNPKLELDYFDKRFFLRALIYGNTVINNTKLRSLVQINLSNLYETSTFNESNAFVIHQDISKNCQYIKDNNLSARVEISKFDTIQRIIAGKFNCKIYIDSACDTVTITDGRFDVKY